MKTTKLIVISAENEFELVKKINEDKREFFATQPYQKNDNSWVMFCYMKDDILEGEKSPNEQLATKSQIYYLKENKLPIKEGLTKKEAFSIIKEHKEIAK